MGMYFIWVSLFSRGSSSIAQKYLSVRFVTEILSPHLKYASGLYQTAHSHNFTTTKQYDNNVIIVFI